MALDIAAPSGESTPVSAPASPARSIRVGKRRLSARQLAAIGKVMHLFVDEDLDRGVPQRARIYCVACQLERPSAGAIWYVQHLLCNACATEFEIARAGAAGISIGRFVRDKRFDF